MNERRVVGLVEVYSLLCANQLQIELPKRIARIQFYNKSNSTVFTIIIQPRHAIIYSYYSSRIKTQQKREKRRDGENGPRKERRNNRGARRFKTDHR